MTVLITLDNPERTGAPLMTLQYVRALIGAGHRVLVACGPPSAGTASVLADLEALGAQVCRFPAFTLRRVPTVLWRLRRLIRRERVACVIGSQQRDRFFACLSAAWTGRCCVIVAHNQHVFRGRRLPRWCKRRSYGWALRRWADHIVCVSEVVQADVRRLFGIGHERTSVLVNGIDLAAFPTFDEAEARRTRRDLGVADDQLLLLSVGRLDPQKGQDLLLQAFGGIAGRHPRVRLAVAGTVGRSGTEAAGRRFETGLHDLVRDADLDGQVDFLGWRDDVPRLLAAADLYVQPSRWEGWPVALVEAMAAGRPVLASDCSGWPQGFVEGEHGWIVPTGDVAALRRALGQAATTSPRDLRSMGERARCLAERHYDSRSLGKRFVERVEGALAR